MQTLMPTCSGQETRPQTSRFVAMSTQSMYIHYTYGLYECFSGKYNLPSLTVTKNLQIIQNFRFRTATCNICINCFTPVAITYHCMDGCCQNVWH